MLTAAPGVDMVPKTFHIPQILQKFDEATACFLCGKYKEKEKNCYYINIANYYHVLLLLLLLPLTFFFRAIPG